MKILPIVQNTDEWMLERKKSITGSKLGDVVSRVSLTKDAIVQELKELGVEFDIKGKKEDLEPLLPVSSKVKLMLAQPKKIGFYQLIADHIALDGDPDEDPRDKGHRLEEEAVNQLEAELGIKYRRGLFCVSDEHEDMKLSPDGLSENETHAAEAKCLSTAHHLKAMYEKQIPSDYEEQKLQYFIVNPKLERLDFVFYDPLITAKPFFYITFYREDLADEIELYRQYELGLLKMVGEMVEELTF